MTIEEFAIDIIHGKGGLHDYERYLRADFPYSDRVTGAVWALRVLGNPSREGSQEILDAIIERRKK